MIKLAIGTVSMMVLAIVTIFWNQDVKKFIGLYHSNCIIYINNILEKGCPACQYFNDIRMTYETYEYQTLYYSDIVGPNDKAGSISHQNYYYPGKEVSCWYNSDKIIKKYDDDYNGGLWASYICLFLTTIFYFLWLTCRWINKRMRTLESYIISLALWGGLISPLVFILPVYLVVDYHPKYKELILWLMMINISFCLSPLILLFLGFSTLNALICLVLFSIPIGVILPLLINGYINENIWWGLFGLSIFCLVIKLFTKAIIFENFMLTEEEDTTSIQSQFDPPPNYTPEEVPRYSPPPSYAN